jgi:hypothetical protein
MNFSQGSLLLYPAKEVWQSLEVMSMINLALIVNRSGSVVLEELLRTGHLITDLKELILVGA